MSCDMSWDMHNTYHGGHLKTSQSREPFARFEWDMSQLDMQFSLLSRSTLGDAASLQHQSKLASAKCAVFNQIYSCMLAADMSYRTEDYLNLQTRQPLATIQLRAASGLSLRRQRQLEYCPVNETGLSLFMV